ncbi:18250_t:CDS:2 [Dentiscutata erythropus]|uniref:18250_t:CDS:1 n=1 Tax=Dentiscutata erythropus TaxID=1348616 RepID=A0A9N9NEI5_9GLOM|nr:18250_t:CDS:2 [Dentiscutata erythropus]
MQGMAQNLRRYLRKDFATNLKVSSIGVALHSPCISHCLQHAFRNNDTALGTIAGIRNWHEWSWPDNEIEAEYIYARPLPGIGPWKKFTPEDIQKIVKKRAIKKPEPTITTHSHPNKSWTMPMPEIQGYKNFNLRCHLSK